MSSGLSWESEDLIMAYDNDVVREVITISQAFIIMDQTERITAPAEPRNSYLRACVCKSASSNRGSLRLGKGSTTSGAGPVLGG